MKPIPLSRWLVILGVPALAVAFGWSISSDPRERAVVSLQRPPTPGSPSLSSASRLHPTEGAPDTSRSPPPIPATADPAEGTLNARWDDMSPSTRRETQRRLFTEAMKQAHRGYEKERNLARAGDALTQLRAELHATSRGRDEYRRLERAYDALADLPHTEAPR